MEIALKGIGVSPGIAIGTAVTHGVRSLDIPRFEIGDPEAELARLDKAIASVKSDLTELRARTAKAIGERDAAIFDAHLMMLEDVTLMGEAQQRIREEKVNAEFVVHELVLRYSQIMQSLDDPMFRERTRDLMDVGERILSNLLNAERPTLDHLDSPSIVIAHDLSPSDTAKMDVNFVRGMAMDLGGPTSHTSILARAIQIPAVVGLKHVGEHVLSGDTIIVDGTRGFVYIRPEPSTVERYKERKIIEDNERGTLLAEQGDRASLTQDGVSVPTLANIELPLEIDFSLRARAEGVGLFRTEYLFLNRRTVPTEEEQYQAYSEVVRRMAPAPVVIRTLDIGGDKIAAHLQGDAEANPQLGWRAIRFCLQRPDIFRTQLRAILRATAHGDVWLMFPLISGLEELREAKAVLESVKSELTEEGAAFHGNLKVGTMIEVPSAVAVADLLAKECDFFSIGSNDLIQYTLAVDRANERVAYLYEPAHPAVLRMLEHTMRAAQAEGISCGICGELAGSPVFTELLVGLGADSLSMSSGSIPLVRAQIANIRLKDARRFANKLLALPSVSEVKQALKQRFEQRQVLAEYLSQFDRHAIEQDDE